MTIAGTAPLLLALIFILFQEVSIRIMYRERALVRIDFTLFSITFSENKKRKRHIRKSLRKIKNLPLILKATHYTLKHTEAIVLNTSNNSFTPPELLRKIPMFISSGAAIAYLNSTAKNVRIYDVQDFNSKCETTIFPSLLFNTRLIYLIIFPFLFTYYKLKKRFGG